MVVETSFGFKLPQNGGLNSHQNGDYTIRRRDFANEQIWDLCSFVLIVPHVFSNSIFFVIFREHPEFIDHFLGIHGVSISNHRISHSFFYCVSGFFPIFSMVFSMEFPSQTMEFSTVFSMSWNFHLKPWNFHGFFPRFLFHRPHRRGQQPRRWARVGMDASSCTKGPQQLVALLPGRYGNILQMENHREKYGKNHDSWGLYMFIYIYTYYILYIYCIIYCIYI